MWRREESTALQVTLVCTARIRYKKGRTFCGEAPSTFLSFPVVSRCFQKDSKSNHTYSHFYYPLLRFDNAPSHTSFSGKSSSKSYQVRAGFIEHSTCNDRRLRCSVVGENKDAASATNHLQSESNNTSIRCNLTHNKHMESAPYHPFKPISPPIRPHRPPMPHRQRGRDKPVCVSQTVGSIELTDQNVKALLTVVLFNLS